MNTKYIKKITDTVFSTRAAGMYMLLFAAAIGIATFIENDYGTSSAQKVIFKARWFELLLLLFAGTLVANIIRFRMVQQKKWAVLTFHASMIVIILGAGVTRYFGYEGMMHIRERDSANAFLSSNTYLVFELASNGKRYRFSEPVLFATLGNNHFKRSYIVGKNKIGIEVLDFLPNPTKSIVESPDGVPTIKVVVGGMGGREEHIVQYGDHAYIDGNVFNFGNPEEPDAINVIFQNDSLLFKSPVALTQMVMATQQKDSLPAGQYYPMRLRSLYTNGSRNFVIGDFKPNGKVEIAAGAPKMTQRSEGALHVKLSIDGKEKETYITGTSGVEGQPTIFTSGNTGLAVAYGASRITLPFNIQLRDFILEKYPGTNSASSYASEVTLVDPRTNLNHDQRIYMNHILDYQGYRFFQSSYDQDELGTYLSVNHDAWGTWISYIGYILLTLGMIMTLFSKSSRFQQLSENIKKIRPAENTLLVLALAGFMILSNQAFASPNELPEGARVNPELANDFGRVLMQDFEGRLKPMNTFSGEVLRKLSKKESLYGLSPEQVILGMATHPEIWNGIPLISLGKHEEIKKLLNFTGDLASYNDFFGPDGEYLLKEQMQAAFNKPPRERGTFEKELVKVDEKVNICNIIFSGDFMRVFPVPGDSTYTWQSPISHMHGNSQAAETDIYTQYYQALMASIQQGIHDNKWDNAFTLVKELRSFQQKNGGAIMISESKINAELLLNTLDVFNRLGKVYGLLGLAFLALFFSSVFKPNLNLKWPFRIALGVLALGFAFHTLGLGLRWYVSGRAPWSNGYESMIYIGWTTILAGLTFARKSLGGLSAASILSATILMVAHLSWLDPEITPLVPVLKSYWLTIHVSLEAGSYGFLVLGAIIGALNLIFMIFANEKNKTQVHRVIKEMSYISEMTMIGGLIMLSIGTYLGGVWANESWGRYWGWDAKETWALVSILVYSFILHMRFIPGLRGLYAFNVASLFGWASVMMTYFGVNYYLSGLHSYAAGDPVPVPSFVYYAVSILIGISLTAFWKWKKVLS